jgi:hypothetical protein
MLIGGEESGGFSIKGHIPEGDNEKGDEALALLHPPFATLSAP